MEPDTADSLKVIDWHARLLAHRLGLGDIQQREICHSYANACVCTDCTERQRLQAERDQAAAEHVTDSLTTTPRQPWDAIVRKAA